MGAELEGTLPQWRRELGGDAQRSSSDGGTGRGASLWALGGLTRCKCQLHGEDTPRLSGRRGDEAPQRAAGTTEEDAVI